MKSLIDENTETLDDLMCGFSVIQPKTGFRFSLDAVLLAHFAGVKAGDVAADICSGCGVVAFLLLAHKRPGKVFCVEIQPVFCGLITRSAKYNGVEGKIEAVCCDMAKAHEILGYESMDSITCNPPYLKKGIGKASESQSLNIAKREVAMTLETAVESAAKLLKNKGRFAIVHIAERADELFGLMRKYSMHVKRARLVQPDINSAPNLILAEGVKNAASGVKWLPTLNVYEDGRYSKEIREIYGSE
jgi:tRNA1(Val) A37 N6-methylase TrmN6